MTYGIASPCAQHDRPRSYISGRYFPPGQPHSLQAKNTTAAGAEFLLVFDSGSFSEDDTFLLTDWLAHVPKEVLAKNFQVDISAFDHIPSHELYIFPSTPPPDDIGSDMVIPNNTPMPYTYAFSKVNATQLSGGTKKTADSRTFNVSTTICVTEVTVQPGGMRYVFLVLPFGTLLTLVSITLQGAPCTFRITVVAILF